MDNQAEFTRLLSEIQRMSAENAELRLNINASTKTQAWPQFAPVGSKQEKYGFMQGEVAQDENTPQVVPMDMEERSPEAVTVDMEDDPHNVVSGDVGDISTEAMTIEHDKPGFKYPPIAREYGFMAPTDMAPTDAVPFSDQKATAEPGGFTHTKLDRKYGFMTQEHIKKTFGFD